MGTPQEEINTQQFPGRKYQKKITDGLQDTR